MPDAIRREGARIFADTFNEELRLDAEARRFAVMPQSQVQELIPGDLDEDIPQVGIVAPISFGGSPALAVTIGHETSGTVFVISPVAGEVLKRIDWTGGA